MRNIALAATFGLILFGGAVQAQVEGPAPGLETEMMEGVDRALEGAVAAGGGPGPVPLEAPLPPEDAPFLAGPGGETDVLFIARGGCPEGFGGPGAPGMMGCLPEDATLTDEQLEKIYRAKQSFQEKAGPKMLELRTLGRSMRDAMMEPEIDKTKVQAMQNRMTALIGELGSMKVDQQIAIWSAYTPEQRKEIRRNYLKRSVGGPGCGRFGKMMQCRKMMMERRAK